MWHLVSFHFLVIIILLCVFVMLDANVAKESVLSFHVAIAKCKNQMLQIPLLSWEMGKS